MNIKDRIKARLDDLESGLREGRHQASDEERAQMEQLLANVSIFFSTLSEEDRDFLNAARYAIEGGLEWK
ncbi:hypothetical protein [Aquamicrobium soli]|uniref:Uncharacterized protein n=1 Tax=Aquamicrobium soli TaxID=1811518 RepID=A0ABV7K6I9_9HYPH